MVVAIEASLGAGGRLLIDTPDTIVLFYPILGLALAAAAINVWLTRSALGAALRSHPRRRDGRGDGGRARDAHRDARLRGIGRDPRDGGRVERAARRYFELMQ